MKKHYPFQIRKWLIAFLICVMPLHLFAQSNHIVGTVKDEMGVPLIGVNVLEKGTQNGALTDIEGRFSISTKQGATLVLSYIGYVTQEVKVASVHTPLNVILKEDALQLEEMVVIGYGAVRKSDLTGAVARANMGALEKSPNPDLVSGLKGVVPGLNIGVSTQAGSSPSISIRGQNSISGSTSPLIVLDGVIYRGNMIDINPSDIASVDVLKDASSTAIYGSQAANGVIMINTKSAGTAEKKPMIEYQGSISTQTPVNGNIHRLDRDGFEQQIRDIYIDQSRMGTDLLTPNPDFDPANYLRDERAIAGYRAGVNTDWYDLLSVDNPYIMKHSLSLRGRSEKSSYFVSFGYLDQQNKVKNDTYKRHNIRVNLDSQITDWLKVGTQSYFTISNFSGNNTSFSNLFTIPAVVSPYQADGKTLETIVFMGGTNPLLSIDNPNKDIRYVLSGNVYADVSIPWVKGLSYRVNYANTWTIYNAYTFDPYANSLQGQGNKNHTNQNEWTFDNILTYKRDFGKHSLNATFVYGVEKRTYERTAAQANNFTDKSLGYNSLESGQSDLAVVGSDAWQESSLYNMLRLVYTYNNRYIFTGTVRRDGFSGFGEKNKFGTFPSLAVAWRLSEESLMSNTRNWLDNLKIRLSYGVSGNRTAGRYSTMATMTPNGSTGSKGGYLYGDGATPELTQGIQSMANNDLKWETTASVNLGIDFAVLGNRLFGSYDFYVSNTSNLLYNINIPQINGIYNTSIATNIGKLCNHGHEFSVTGVPIRNKDWEWTLTANFSLNKNKVKTILGEDLDGDGKEDDLINAGIFINQPLNTIYDYRIIGMWQLDDTDIPSDFYPGTYKIKNIKGDGYSAADDREIIGYRDPLYRFSIQNAVRYKRWTLNAFINSVQGGSDYYLGRPLGSFYIPDHLLNNSYMKFDYWTPENPNAKYRQLGKYSLLLGENFSPYVSRSFIRLQELSLNYNVPQALLKKIGVSSANIYITGTNLFTITDWDGWDPEANQGLTYNFSGYPTLKTYTVGINLSF